MTEPIFLHVPSCKGVVSSNVEVIQLVAIGSAQKGHKKSVWFNSVLTPESYFTVYFATEEDRDAFLQDLLKLLSRKATVVTI